MRGNRSPLFASLTLTLALTAARPAQAASLTQVNNWQGGVALPTDVTMFVYVPTNVATNPPLLALVHYCGGNASAVFGQASGIVKAADQNGFIIVVPSNGGQSGTGRCWDISSKATQTRDGGGDSHAIIQMVRYALTNYQANANRVYSTGDSSGAMMTQLLLALYPDVFKAGASFAGVPAGCSNAFDSQGLCGLGAQTAQQWGDRVRAMYPGYSGHRPRVQLFHGSADATINFGNFNEGIKEWTNVLGLSATPTSTTNGLTLGSHQATRQAWKDSCGYVVLDAFTSIGGDHGPSDALFVPQYVLPFLGLDQPGAVDPEIAQCGSDGGGGPSGGDGGVDANGSGGGSSSGGSSGSGGGSSGSVGSSGSGGNSSGGAGGGSTGGASGSGGALDSGGAPSGGSDGSAGQAEGGLASTGDAGGNFAENGPGSRGCGCALVGDNSKKSVSLSAIALGFVAATSMRRRRTTRKS